MHEKPYTQKLEDEARELNRRINEGQATDWREALSQLGKERVERNVKTVEELIPGARTSDLPKFDELIAGRVQRPYENLDQIGHDNQLEAAHGLGSLLSNAGTGMPRYVSEITKGQVIIDIGAGKTVTGYKIAKTLNARGYIGDEPYAFKELAEAVADMCAYDEHETPFAVAPIDALALLRRLPDNSVSITSSHFEWNIMPGEEYRSALAKEIERVLSPDGVYISYMSSINPNLTAIRGDRTSEGVITRNFKISWRNGDVNGVDTDLTPYLGQTAFFTKRPPAGLLEEKVLGSETNEFGQAEIRKLIDFMFQTRWGDETYVNQLLGLIGVLMRTGQKHRVADQIRKVANGGPKEKNGDPVSRYYLSDLLLDGVERSNFADIVEVEEYIDSKISEVETEAGIENILSIIKKGHEGDMTCHFPRLNELNDRERAEFIQHWDSDVPLEEAPVEMLLSKHQGRRGLPVLLELARRFPKEVAKLFFQSLIKNRNDHSLFYVSILVDANFPPLEET